MTRSDTTDSLKALWGQPLALLVLWRQLKSHYVVAVLSLLVLGSAMGVAWSSFLVRAGTTEREFLIDDNAALNLEWQKLSLEQSAMAEHSRVESIARKQLQMKHPDAASELVVQP